MKIFSKISNVHKLFFIYCISHIGSLIVSQGIYYDDFVFYNLSDYDFKFNFIHISDLFNFRFHIFFILKNLSPFYNGIIAFIIFFFSSVIFQKVLEKYFLLNKNKIFLIILLYLVLPFGIIKFSLSIIPYLICLNFFFIGWYFMNGQRILSLIFFFLSFNLNSLLMLFSLPFLSYFLYCNKKSNFKLIIFFNFFKKNFDLVILPFLFYGIKILFFQPEKYYENYNQNYNFVNLFIYSLRQFFDLFRDNLSVGFFLTGIAISIFILKFIFKFQAFEFKKKSINIYIAVVGILSSLIPYWIIGHTPAFVGYYSRHQLLLLITVPFVIIYILENTHKKNLIFVLVLILSIAFSMNFKIYGDYFKDYLRQQSIANFVNKNKKNFEGINVIVDTNLTNNSLIRFSLVTPKLNNAFYKMILKNEKNFVIQMHQIDDYLNGEFDTKFNSWNFASEHVRIEKPNFIFVNTISKGFANYETKNIIMY